MRKQDIRTATGLAFLIILLAACTPLAAPTATSIPSPSAAASFTDPYAYCQAVGNADTPGPEFTGPKMTKALAQAIKTATGASADAPLDLFMQGSTWRCMNGKVYACFVGANLPCDSKANTDATPTPEEQDFCTANPNSDSIPAAVTGHDTVFAWTCKDGKPEAGQPIVEVDSRGYITSIWYALPAP